MNRSIGRKDLNSQESGGGRGWGISPLRMVVEAFLACECKFLKGKLRIIYQNKKDESNGKVALHTALLVERILGQSQVPMDRDATKYIYRVAIFMWEECY